MKKSHLLTAFIIANLLIAGIVIGSMLITTNTTKISVTDKTRIRAITEQSKSQQLPLSEIVFQQEENVTEATGELVDSFPDIPIYPALKIDKTYKKEIGGKTNYVGVWFYEGDINKIMDWYAYTLKNTGWSVTGPYIQEGEDDLEIDAENANYTLRLLNSEREEEDSYTPGKIIMVDLTQK